jgi:hypothetical protein
MGDQAEQAVEGDDLLASEQQEQAGDGECDDQHARGHVEGQGERQRHADQGGLGDGLAVVGHAAPDHEAAERRGDHGKAEAEQQGAQQEGMQHDWSPREISGSRGSGVGGRSPGDPDPRRPGDLRLP